MKDEKSGENNDIIKLTAITLSTFFLIAAQVEALDMYISSHEYEPSGVDTVSPAIEEGMNKILEIDSPQTMG